MSKTITTLDKTFAVLVAAAVDGRRCPFSQGPEAAISSQAVSRLAKSGRIYVEISSRNWRQVTIMVGEHKGKATAPNPDRNAHVYQTIGAEGTKVNNRFVDHGAASRGKPSLPKMPWD